VYLLQLLVATSSRDASAAAGTAFVAQLKRQSGLAVIGPAPAFIEQQSQKFVWTITVKSKHRSQLVAIASNLPDDRWTANLDPVNLL
jgi:primosomal protein N'